MNELIVDSFAGGGGASLGITWALDRGPDIAINHDPEAIALHSANHPDSKHYCQDVWEVDPVDACQGRPVGLMWLSPDCKHFSKAKGGKPVSKKVRGLAWVAVRWAKVVKPRIIILENVEEFQSWGPLGEDGKPCKAQKGRTFRLFIRRLENLGYKVQYRELRACDYGAPTSRKRLFLIARCDGQSIVWPKPTHGPGRIPYRTASECIDWTIPGPLIFLTKDQGRQIGVRRPLAEPTLRRIARGVRRYVVEAEKPFLVPYYSPTRDGDHRTADVDGPLPTQPTQNRFGLVVPFFVPRYGERPGQEPRILSVQDPHPVIVPTGNGASLVTAFLAKHYGGHETPGSSLELPFSTITAIDHHALVTADLVKTPQDRSDEVHAFLVAYYGNEKEGGSLFDPMRTVTAKERFGLVAVSHNDYVIADIGMRMLAPRELYRAQGFPDSYKIDIHYSIEGKIKRMTKTAQVRMVGNSVCPNLAHALVEANMSAQLAIAA